MKKIIAGLLIWTQIAFAGKLQDADFKTEAQLISAGATASSLLNDTKIYVTANGINKKLSSAITAGDIGGGSGKSYLTNSNFENSTVATGWTVTNSTATAETTEIVEGAQSIKLALSSQTGDLLVQSVTPSIKTTGQNFSVSCRIKTTLTTVEFCSMVNGAESQCQTVSSGGGFVKSNLNITPADGVSFGVKVKAISSSTGNIYVDECYAGQADNIYDAPLVTAWTSYTPTFTGLGTVTSITTKYRRVGDSLNIIGNFTIGTVAGSLASLSLPSGLTIDTTKLSGASTNQYIGFGITDLATVNATKDLVLLASPSNSSTLVYMGLPDYAATGSALTPKNGNALFVSSSVISFNATIPILGWSAVSAVSADQTDYGWTSWTPTFTGFGTVTSIDCKHSRVSQNMLIMCRGTAGTPTAVEAQITLPNGLTVSSTHVSSKQVVGATANTGNTSTTFSQAVLATGGDQFLNFGTQTSSTGSFVEANGNAVAFTSNVLAFTATVPITGWETNQRAPTLVGSVTSNSTSALRIENIAFGGSGTFSSTTACTSSPCTIYKQSSSWTTSVTRSSAGTYVLNFPSSTFSSAPICTCSVNNDSGNTCTAQTPTITTVTIYTGIGVDKGANVFCMEPR